MAGACEFASDVTPLSEAAAYEQPTRAIRPLLVTKSHANGSAPQPQREVRKQRAAYAYRAGPNYRARGVSCASDLEWEEIYSMHGRRKKTVATNKYFTPAELLAEEKGERKS